MTWRRFQSSSNSIKMRRAPIGKRMPWTASFRRTSSPTRSVLLGTSRWNWQSGECGHGVETDWVVPSCELRVPPAGQYQENPSRRLRMAKTLQVPSPTRRRRNSISGNFLSVSSVWASTGELLGARASWGIGTLRRSTAGWVSACLLLQVGQVTATATIERLRATADSPAT